MTAPIIPNTGPSSSPPPLTSPTTFTTTTTTSVDNQSAYSADIAANKDLTIIGFSSIILASSNEAAQTSWQIQQYNASSRKDLYNASILQSLDLAQIYSIFLKVATDYTSAARNNKNGVNSLNNQITNYNNDISTDQSQINTLNAAIANYNSGSITLAQLNTAINSYNNYVANRNAAITLLNNRINNFNADVAATNASVDEINEELIAQGAPPLKYQEAYPDTANPLPTAPTATSPPVATINYTPTTLVQVTNSMTPVSDTDTGVELASALFQPLFDLLAGQFAITAAMLQQQSTFQGFVQFFLTNKLPFIPDAFYTPQAPVSASGNATAGSVSSTALTASLSSNFLEAILSQNKFLASIGRILFEQNFNQAKGELQYLQSAFLSQLGLQSGSTALRLLGDRLPFIDLRASPVAAALGITLASEISLAVSNGDLNGPVKDILARAFPNIDAASLDSLTKQLSTTLALSLSLTGLFQLGIALKDPQLLAQLTGNLSGVNALGINTATASSILKDQQTARVIQDELSRSLANSANISSDEARKNVQNALSAATNSTSDDISQSYQDSLTQQGITQQQSIDSANLLDATIQSEILAKDILNRSVKADNSSNSLLSNQLTSQIVSQNPNLTYRELRDQLANQFIANGATQPQALNYATLAITGNPLAIASPSANSQSVSANLQTTAANLAANLGLTPAQKDTLTDLLKTTVTNLQNQINQNLTDLSQVSNDKVAEKARENFQTFLAPTLDLYVFADKLRDPANTLLYCAQNGPMYSGHQQIKDIDIHV